MIEQGIVTLVNADATVAGILGTNGGGFYATLPKDQPKPSWSYLLVSSTTPSRTLDPQRQLVQERWQLDVFGNDPDDVIRLARAIDAVLFNYSGVLPDPDATLVQAVFREDLIDHFDDTARDYRRSLDYLITFVR